MRPPLVLASTSPYRAELLARLTPDFECLAPDVDETPAPDESPEALAVRLAAAKAEAVGRLRPNALVIGGDQVLCCEGRALGKPGGVARATDMLLWLSGKSAEFLSAVCVLEAASGRARQLIERWTVRYRTLSAEDVAAYLALDRPFDCAGAIRTEAHGPLILDEIQGGDPNALIGLPLVSVAGALREFGLDLLHVSRPD